MAIYAKYVLILLLWAQVVSPLVAAEAPNFVCIVCDDLGYGDLGCYGHPLIKTPHLDRMASEGIRLTNCYASAPVCSPSRAGMMTGRTPSRVGVYDWIPGGSFMHLRGQEITVATLLKQAGYSTCHAGKWHLNGRFNNPAQPQPGDHGFDHWFSTHNNASPTHHNPKNFVRNGAAVGPAVGYSCQIVADETIDWLRSGRDRSKPFFAFVCFHEPHEPIDSPPELVEKYRQCGATEEGQAQHHANIENMDDAVGRVVRAVDEMGLAENTLIFFTSDNGPETLNRYPGAWRSHGSPGPFRGMKLWLYEGGIRVPGILRWTRRIDPGQVVAEPVCGVDVLPTLCELSGSAVPQDRVIDGTSIVPVLSGLPIQRKTPLYWHYFNALGEPKAAMRIGNWMILGAWDQQERTAGVGFSQEAMKHIKQSRLVDFELYNLRADPTQQRNLASEDPQRLEKLSDMLKRKHAEVQQEGPVWEKG
jgi:arylsulfatase A